MTWVRDRRSTDFVEWGKNVRASVQRGCKGEAISYLPCGNKHHQEPIQELSIIFPSWIGLLGLVLLSRVVLHPKQSADVNEVGFLTSGRPNDQRRPSNFRLLEEVFRRRSSTRSAVW